MHVISDFLDVLLMVGRESSFFPAQSNPFGLASG